jgi:small subunit ribosomal protein S6
VNVEPWGRRRLAYPIGAFRDGFYIVTRFKMPPEESDTLERNLRLNESVLRHLVVRLDLD